MSQMASCRRMHCLKSHRERFTTAESWSPPSHVAYHPLRVSRSAAKSCLHSLDNSQFSNERQSLRAAGGFFALENDDNDYLLEDSLVPLDSTEQCFCKCGQEFSFPRMSRSILGHLPDVEEEIGIPFPRDLHWSSNAPQHEKFCYTYTRPESNLEFIYPSPSGFGLETSRGVSYFSTNDDTDSQRSCLEDEILVNSSLSRCTLGQARHHDERRMHLSAHEKFRCIDQESPDIYSSGMALDPMSSFNSPPNEMIQSPSYEIHFRSGQGPFVPIRPKQAMCYSPSDVPSSSSVSVRSDETEHPGSIRNSKSDCTRPSSADPGKKQVFVDMDPSASLRMETTISAQFLAILNIKRRSFTETGLCSYGKRCRFVHSSSSPVQTLPRSSHLQLEKTNSRRLSIFQQLCGANEKPLRQP